MGPMGPQGPQGPQGPAGPTEKASLLGIETSLTGSSAGSIADDAPIAFDTVDLNNANGISYSATSGTYTFQNAGTYLVNWWVALQCTQTVTQIAFAVSVNGTDVSAAYADVGDGQVSGTALIQITSAPATVQLLNVSGGAVTLAAVAEQAGATILQIA